MGNYSILNISNVIGKYPQLTPTPILITPIANSQKENYYDMLVEDDDKEDNDVTIVTSNATYENNIKSAGNTEVYKTWSPV